VRAFVVDSSVDLAWLYDDEDVPRADDVVERLIEDSAFVPQLWHLEIRNSLLVAERRGRLTWGAVVERLDALSILPIQTDEEPDYQAALELARRHGLSFYDALYLELARRRRAELATLDRGLGRAAASEGVALVAI